MMDVTVRTRTLTLVELSQERLEKLNLIDDLYQQGLNSREIADHLNQRGIRSPKGGTYYLKLVWVTHKQLKRRHERMKDTTYTVDAIYPAKLERVSHIARQAERLTRFNITNYNHYIVSSDIYNRCLVGSLFGRVAQISGVFSTDVNS